MRRQMMRIERWFSQHLPTFLADLAPGCSEAALAETESLIGSDLPGDYKDLYRWHDGQKTSHYSGIFYGLSFISLADVRRQWRSAIQQLIPSRKILHTRSPQRSHFLDSVKVMFADKRER